MKHRIVATKGDRQWQGIPAIERAQNGRLWCAFFSGGSQEPEPENFILLTSSLDNGVTWSDAEPIVTPDGLTRAYDPALWHDPNGSLWLFYNEANLETKDFSVWAMATRNSGEATPVWGKPRKIDLKVPFAFRLNKPTVLTTGEWLLPVTWSRSGPEVPSAVAAQPGKSSVTWSRSGPDGWFCGARQLQGIAISTDRGTTWTLHGAVEAPEWALENMIVERRDRTLWMLIRTGGGVLWESVSHDVGQTWSKGVPTSIVNPGSRFFIRRLASGRLLLINTPDSTQRNTIYAYLSEEDDDTSFSSGLQLDERDKVAYPDAVQAPDGLIYAVHDCNRYGPGEILLSVFSEHEILAEPGMQATAEAAPDPSC